MFVRKSGNKIKKELGELNIKKAGIGAGLAVFFGMSGFIFSADPFFVTHYAHMPGGTPPLFLLVLMQLILYAVLGFLIACLICCPVRHLRCYAYNAALYLTLALIFCCTWYPLFFAARTPILALIALAAALTLSILSLINCSRIYIIFTISHLFYIVYLLFIFYLNFAFLLIN